MGIKRRLKGLCFFCLDAIAPLVKKSVSIEGRSVAKVLVVAGGGIGDLIGLLPAISALHENFPRATITLLASPLSTGVLELYPLRSAIDEVVLYEPEARHRGLVAKLMLIRSLRKRGFDLSYAASRGHGMREEMVMTYLIGAPMRLGFTLGKTGYLNTRTVEFSANESIPRQNLELLRAQGLKVRGEAIDLEVPRKGLEGVYAFLEQYGLKGGTSFFVIHPGASWQGFVKCWPVEKYIELIGALVKQGGQKVVVIGSREEEAMGRAISRVFREDTSVINAIGKTSLMQAAGLISLARLFIGNDSGPLHLAQAFNVPVVAIFGCTSPAQVIWRKERCVIIGPPSAAPRYLHQYNFETNAEDANVLDLITVQDVTAGVAKALETMT